MDSTEQHRIPEWTRADVGALTHSGKPAKYRSSPHAWFALRLMYLEEVKKVSPDTLAATEDLYRRSWDRFVRLGAEIQQMVADIDSLTDAATIWNRIDQYDTDDACSRAIGEREGVDQYDIDDPRDTFLVKSKRSPKTNLATMARNHYRLAPLAIPGTKPDRKLTDRDNEAAWQLSPGGTCRGCGTLTISQRQYARLRDLLPANPNLFNLAPTYERTKKDRTRETVPLWSNRILIASKGVADHITARSHGGLTSPENLANVCYACNYSRGNSSLDDVGVAAYT